MKKGVKKNNKKNYSSDHVAVLLERMDGKFDLLAEGQKNFERRFDNLENEFDKLGNRFDRFEADVKFQFKAVGEGMAVLSDKVDNLEKNLDSVASNVVEIKHKLSQKVDLEDFQKSEKKAAKLEKLILSRAT